MNFSATKSFDQFQSKGSFRTRDWQKKVANRFPFVQTCRTRDSLPVGDASAHAKFSESASVEQYLKQSTSEHDNNVLIQSHPLNTVQQTGSTNCAPSPQRALGSQTGWNKQPHLIAHHSCTSHEQASIWAADAVPGRHNSQSQCTEG